MGRRGRRNGRKEYYAVRRIEILARQAGVDRGRYNEERALQCLQDCLAATGHRPPWLKSCRLSDERHNRLGIDLIVETDCHPIYVQVKSSFARLKQFHVERYRRWRQGHRVLIIGEVVVNIHLTDRQVGGALMSEIRTMYDIIKNLGTVYLPVAEVDLQVAYETNTKAAHGQ